MDSFFQFDVGSWLNYRRPRLSERSTFIDLVSKALYNIGLNPEEEKLMLHEVRIIFVFVRIFILINRKKIVNNYKILIILSLQLFRNHLRLILLHEFPEHYGEVLSAVLKGSESQNLSLDVWRDLLGALSGKSKNIAPIYASKIRDEIRHYATEQRLLSRQEVPILLSK